MPEPTTVEIILYENVIPRALTPPSFGFTYQTLVTMLSCHQTLTVAVTGLRITRIPTRDCSQRIASASFIEDKMK